MHIPNGVRYFCAVDKDHNIVGISARRLDPIIGFDVMGIGVHPSMKRQGIGKLLMNNLLNIAKSDGFYSIEVHVFADNVIMLRLLLSLGFLPTRMEYSKRADGMDLVFLRNVLKDK